MSGEYFLGMFNADGPLVAQGCDLNSFDIGHGIKICRTATAEADKRYTYRGEWGSRIAGHVEQLFMFLFSEILCMRERVGLCVCLSGTV